MRVLNDISTWITVCTLSLIYFLSTPSTKYVWWQKLVEFLRTKTDLSDRLIFVMVSQLILEGAFFTIVILIYILTKIGFLEKYRLQPIPSDPLRVKNEEKLNREAFIDVLIGHWLVRPLLFVFLYPYFESRAGPLDAPIPSFRHVLPQIFACMIIDDTYFYWTHRLFHTVPFASPKHIVRI